MPAKASGIAATKPVIGETAVPSNRPRMKPRQERPAEPFDDVGVAASGGASAGRFPRRGFLGDMALRLRDATGTLSAGDEVERFPEALVHFARSHGSFTRAPNSQLSGVNGERRLSRSCHATVSTARRAG